MSDNNWYILHVDTDVNRIIIGLGELGIPCLDVSKAFAENNVSFPSENVGIVLDYVGKGGNAYVLEPTSSPNIFSIHFHSDVSDYSVRPGQNFERWEDMVPVMKSVYDIFGIRIIPDNPHGEVKKPVSVGSDSGLLYIHFYSTPTKTFQTNKYVISKAFGVPLYGGQRDKLRPSGMGIPIKDEEGVIVAEYLNDNLYILFDLPHNGGEDNVTEVFARTMRAYFAMRGKTEAELSRFYQSITRVISYIVDPIVSYGDSSREKFARECNKLMEQNLKSMENTYTEYNVSISEYNRKMVEIMRERDLLLLKLEPLKLSVESRKAWADKEYDTLCELPHVKSVKVEGRIISVYTDTIYIRHMLKTYDIGEFRIDIYTDGSELGVRAFNLTNPQYGGQLAHPHVKQKDGYCCLGNLSAGISKLLSEYQYVIVAQLMINYLLSYNEDSAYGKISAWG